MYRQRGAALYCQNLGYGNHECSERYHDRNGTPHLRAHGLLYELRWFDDFPASVNHEQCNQLIRNSALKHGFTVKERPLPFKFGEDFGWYSAAYRSAMFGLGSGEDSSALHHHDYDFPYEIAVTGIPVFAGIIEEVLG